MRVGSPGATIMKTAKTRSYTAPTTRLAWSSARKRKRWANRAVTLMGGKHSSKERARAVGLFSEPSATSPLSVSPAGEAAARGVDHGLYEGLPGSGAA